MPRPPWLNQYEDLWLFDEMKENKVKVTAPMARVVIGQFFEVLAAAVLKAEHASPPDDWSVYPDVIKWGESDTLYEIKGGAKGFLIDVGQIYEYEKIMKTDFPFTKPDVKYILFAYDMKQIVKSHSTLSSLVKDLCRKVVFGVQFPFEIVRQLPDKMHQYSYGKWGVTRQHPNYLRFKVTDFRKWIEGGIEGIRENMVEYFGKEALDWTFTSSLIKRKRILDCPVKPFNFIEVTV